MRLDLVGGFAVLFDSRLCFGTQVFIWLADRLAEGVSDRIP